MNWATNTATSSCGMKWTTGNSLTEAYNIETTSTGSAAFLATIMNQFQATVMEADSAKARFKLCDRLARDPDLFQGDAKQL